MKSTTFTILSGALLFSLQGLAEGGSTSSPPKTSSSKATGKSQFNSQIYEKEDSHKMFTATVKAVREVQGDTEVFFIDQSGFFLLNTGGPNAGLYQNLLIASQTKKTPVQVTVDSVSRQILNVALAGN